MNCPKCGFETQDGALFCAKCATRLGTGAQISVTRTLETKPEGLGKGELFAGRFELIEELGAGGMGIVYRAYDKEVGEEIALKVLHPEIALDERTVDRFRNEIKLARRITHKNVCRMHELHQDGKELFITMEYVPGQDLKGLIVESETLPAGRAISIAKQVCEGLAEAHDLGVIHRDLKSQNIMVDKEGNAKIMDFGIARSLRTAGMTGEGMIIGTPEYMAPEQVEGQEADQRTDIYALGAIIFEMVTGRVPFEGDSPLSVAYKHKNEPPIPPRKLNAEIPEPLNGLILRCLEKEKDNRYQTADEVLADLVRIEDGLPISERVVLKARPTIHIAREKPTGIKRFLVPALALVVTAGGAAAVWRFLLHPAGPALANMENSIAVISFENQTGDKAFDDLRKTIPDRLIMGLEQTQSFYVMSAERQRHILKQLGKPGLEFIDSDVGFELCRKEGVRSLVTGSFYRSGDTYFTDVKVLDVKTKRLLHTANAQGQGPDSLFIGQVDELSRKIAAGQGVAKEKLDATRPASEFGTNSREAYKYYLQGSEDWGNWQYRKAIASLEKAVEIDPEFASAYLALAGAYEMADDLPASGRAAAKALSLSKKAPEKDRLYIEADHALIDEKNEEKGIAVLKELIAKFPKESRGHLALGSIYWRSDPDKAIKELDIALTLIPDETHALNLLGYIYMGRKEYPEALGYFQKQMELRQNLNSYDSLAECYFRAGMVEEAKSTLRKLSGMPGSTRFNPPRYISALEEDYAETLRLLGKQLEVCPPEDKYHLYLERGFYRGWLGNLNGSMSDLLLSGELAGAMGRKGAVASAMWMRSWIYLDQHALDLSRKSTEEYHAYGLKERPEFAAFCDVRYHELLGHIDCAEGKTDSAESHWKHMEALIPKVEATNAITSQEALLYQAGLLRAEVELAQGGIDEVIRRLERPAPLPRTYASNLFTSGINVPIHRDILARAYVKKGAVDKAIAEYERLTTFDPKREVQFLNHPKYHYRLGLLYEQKGQAAKAAERYRKFLDLWKAADPQLPEVADATKRLAALS